MAIKLLEALLALTTRSPSNPFIQILPLPGEALLDEFLLLFAVGTEIFDQRPSLFRGAFLHLTDLLLQVNSARTAALPKQTLLDIIPHQESFDLILVKLVASCQGLFPLGAALGLFCESACVKGNGFLNGEGCTT